MTKILRAFTSGSSASCGASYRTATFLGLILCVGACEETTVQTPRHTVTITVESDPGTPLAGVVFDVDGQPLGTSNEFGLVHTVLEGREGTSINIHHACPEGTVTADEETQALPLIAFQSVDPNTASGLQMTVRCTPTTRQAAFIVDAGGFADLPVLINGEQVAVTDETGIAHAVVDSTPNANFRVELATADFERIRPRDISETFQLGARSDVFVFHPTISLEPLPRRRRRRARTQTITMITRLD